MTTVLVMDHLIHVIAAHPHLDTVAYLDTQRFLLNFIDHSLDTTAGHDAVAFLHLSERLLEFLALFLLRPENQKVQNGNQWEE